MERVSSRYVWSGYVVGWIKVGVTGRGDCCLSSEVAEEGRYILLGIEMDAYWFT